MATQTTTAGASVPALLHRPTVSLTALGEVVLGLIRRQEALPFHDMDGRDAIEREIDALLGLED